MRNFRSLFALSAALIAAACNDTAVKNTVDSKNAETSIRALPALKDYIACLPQETALVAAHRGTARNSKYPENSISGLKTLIEKGYLISEIDVAGLKDGVHILYHDGVWDEESTGKGPLASSTWKDAEKILLNDTRGKVSADRPVSFEDYLITSKGNIYLEIDFKSSAKYETVLALIRKHEMADQVILISYSEGQSRKLSRLAPDMMLSISPEEALGQMRFNPGQVAAWLGYNLNNKNLIQNLRDKDVPILGRIKKEWTAKAADAADVLVTDNVFSLKPILGLTKNNRLELESCLAKL